MNNVLLSNGELCDKIATHKQGLKHYAFSVFLFNKNNELLMQKRANNKYHSGGLWSNTCCSHFKDKNEFNNKEETIRHRLYEELGVRYQSNFMQIAIFQYHASVGDNFIENEVDYIFKGIINNDLKTIKNAINKEEVSDVNFVSINSLIDDIKLNKNLYTSWLQLILAEDDILSKLLF